MGSLLGQLMVDVGNVHRVAFLSSLGTIELLPTCIPKLPSHSLAGSSKDIIRMSGPGVSAVFLATSLAFEDWSLMLKKIR